MIRSKLGKDLITPLYSLVSVDLRNLQELNKKLDLERQNELDRLEAINRKLKLDRQNDLEFFQKMEMNKHCKI